MAANNEILVEVENVSKRFCKDFKRSIRYGFMDALRALAGRDLDTETLRKDEFWAVKDVSFQLRRGECLGLIGHNGAGKSTLLKMLNGLIRPDHGKITMRGRIGALIELGAGFNPFLTGRENIYNNAAVLGFSKEETEKKFDEIVAFSEIGDFLDMPVQNYSCGMKVRLGFAVAAQLDPDVLIIDEVLAVGDLGFVLKCFKTIDTILPNTAVIFVSHMMPLVSRICNQILLLDHGVSQFQGKEVAKGIDLYYNHFASNDQSVVFDDGTFIFESAELLNFQSLKNDIPQLLWQDDISLYFKFRATQKTTIPFFKIIITDKEYRPIAIFDRNTPEEKINCDEEGVIEFSATHRNAQFAKGIYNVDIGLFHPDTEEPYLRINHVITFQVIHDEDIWTPFLLASNFEPINKIRNITK